MLQASDYSLLKKIYYKNKKKISINKNHKKTKVLDKDKHNLNMLNQNGFCVLKGVFCTFLFFCFVVRKREFFFCVFFGVFKGVFVLWGFLFCFFRALARNFFWVYFPSSAKQNREFPLWEVITPRSRAPGAGRRRSW